MLLAFVLSQAVIGGSFAQTIERLRSGADTIQCEESESILNQIFSELQGKYEVHSCVSEMPLGGIEYLLGVLADDLETDVFNRIHCILSLGVSLHGDPIRCITIQEWFFSNEHDAHEGIEHLNQIPHRTIHYKPPNNWKWIRSRSKVYFIYSESYDSNSREMNETFEVIRDVVGHEE